MTDKPLRAAVIGLGHNGLAWCETYQQARGTILAAVCDLDAERAASVTTRFSVEARSFPDILADPTIDIVSVHTADHQHAEPFVQAIAAGKHVFVEKPLANSLEDVRRMVEAARRSDRFVMVGQVLRFYPLYEQIKKMVEGGLLGEITYAEADYVHDLRYQQHMERWKLAEEIPMVGGGCHPYDLLRWFLDDEPEWVTAASNRIAYREMKEDTSIAAIFRFRKGAVAKVAAVYGSPTPARYNLALYGTRGSIHKNKFCYDGMDRWMEISGGQHKNYLGEAEHFAECIRTGKRPLVDILEGARTVSGCLAAVKAARTGKPVKPELFEE